MPLLGEKFGISLEILDGRLAMLQDGAFAKAVQLQENFTSVRQIELSNEIYTSTSIDQNDPLFSMGRFFLKLTTGIQKKVFSQYMDLGIRKIEVIQGLELGQAVIRASYSLERAMKWQLQIPFELENQENTIRLPQEIQVTIQTEIPVKYEDDLITFNIPEGFTQIFMFVNSFVPYDRIAKNLLLIAKGDQSKQDIIEMGANQKFYPIITFVYLQDFKNKIERYQDLHQIGSILAVRKQHTEAIKYLKKALTTVRSLGDQLKEAEILITLATVENDAGNYEQAAKDYNYALKIAEEFQNESLRIGILISLSKTLKKLRRFQEALDYQYMILEHVRMQRDRLGEAEILVDISDSLMGLGRIDEAIEYQQAVINLRRQMNDQIGEANNLMIFGALLTTAGRTGEAMSCYEQALRIKRNLGDDKGVAECLKSMGDSFYKLGKYEKARTYYEKAKEAFQNQALILEVEKIDKMLDKMKERPLPECEVCTHKCTPDIIGIAHQDAINPSFAEKFKQVLRESLAQKNMDKLVDHLQEAAQFNLDIKTKGISNDSYAYCLMTQASNVHLPQLNLEQKKQILKMVQETIRKRKYAAL
ncbi:MAG: tetratricopeptide repeat protein [Candidatus Helarchaeota archaeon]